MRVVGMISGTSMDGIDVAAADLSLIGDELHLRPLGTSSVPYPADLREQLEGAMPPAATTAEVICQLDTRIGQVFGDVAASFLQGPGSGAELVVSHGQTLYHWVDEDRAFGSLQIGQPAWIAAAAGLPVIADLRSADIAAGGQGAPLASLFDALLLADADGVRAALNIGGIANVTVVGRGEPFAYDTGPGNALIDAAVRHLTRGEQSYDESGELAAGGEIHQRLLELLLEDPYYRLSPPKTTGKERFHLPYLQAALVEVGPVRAEDVVATVTALTARTIGDACRAHGVDDVVVAGGGVLNPTLMTMIEEELAATTIRTIDELGIPAGFKEAYFIAMIGFLTANGLPGNLPSATGARRPAVLGSLHQGPRLFEPPPPARIPPTRLRVVDGSV